MNRITKQRESGIELLRLICMLFILLHHFLIHGLDCVGVHGGPVKGWIIMDSLFIIAVNCFVLISGYFGIKAKWKGFFHLYIMCAFYNVALTMFHAYDSGNFELRSLLSSFFVFSHPKWWFIESYIYLFMLSPMLNWTIKSIQSRKDFILLLLIWSVFVFYFGFLWKKALNPTGYSVINFIFLYFIGRFIAIYVKEINSRFIVISFLICIGIVVAINTSFFLLGGTNYWIFQYGLAYNNPFIILAAVLFFLCFKRLSFKNSYINWFASSALSIYLIHEHPAVSYKLYDYIASFISVH